MKRHTRMLVFTLWIIFVSVLLTRLWISQPYLFAEFPKPIAEYFANLYGAQNAEQLADLEILIGLSIFMPLVSALTFIAYRVLRPKR